MRFVSCFGCFLLVSLSACAPAELSAEPALTPTVTPNSTATATIFLSPIPDATEEVVDKTLESWGKQGILVSRDGTIRYDGKQLPAASIDVAGFHLQVGDTKIDIPQSEAANRVMVKEGSVVVYDKSIDFYQDASTDNWPKVEWVFYPAAMTELWKGWISRDKAISSTVYPNLTSENYGEPIIPVIAGDTWDEYHDFVMIERAFLQPFPEGTILPTPQKKDYASGPDYDTPPFKVSDWSNFGMRNAVNFWIVEANPEEKRESNTGGITEQIFSPKNKFDIQTLHFVSGDTSGLRISEFFKDSARFGTVFPNGYLIPIYYPVGPTWNSAPRFVNIRRYYTAFGYADPVPGSSLGEDNGKLAELVLEWMNTLVVPEELQSVWLTDQAWFVR